ncbi:hypothetical protein C0Q70_21029 [Pomacea canaliculata]|uniref:Uncharacterized protein n=1 Tax=Pomacea canaliculata TaxID=400727 RepID=A0A2T7NBC8_POMCA|nr:hypothetical protein C0Q70_21029 [Pomacea canaliculata]
MLICVAESNARGAPYLERKVSQVNTGVLTDADCQAGVERHVTGDPTPGDSQALAVGKVRRNRQASNDDDGDDDDDDDCENSETESVSGGQTMTLSTPEENQPVDVGAEDKPQGPTPEQASLTSSSSSAVLPGVKLPAGVKSVQDSECESVLSDYSELGGPLKELEKELELIDREELRRSTDFAFLRLRLRGAGGLGGDSDAGTPWSGRSASRTRTTVGACANSTS